MLRKGGGGERTTQLVFTVYSCLEFASGHLHFSAASINSTIPEFPQILPIYIFTTTQQILLHTVKSDESKSLSKERGAHLPSRQVYEEVHVHLSIRKN